MEKTDDYKATANIYKKETEVINDDYDLLKYSKEYIEAHNKIKEELKNCSNLALAGVIDYLNKLTASGKDNSASNEIRDMIIATLESKDPKLEDDVVEKYPKM